MLNRFRKYINILSSINWRQSFYLFLIVKKPRSSSIRVLNRSHITISHTARIIMDEHASLEINRCDFFIDKGSLCRIQLQDRAVMHITGRVSLHRNSYILLHNGANLTIGNNTYINGARIDCSHRISIGNNCAIADGVTILDDAHHKTSRQEDSTLSYIRIGDKVWIASNAIILPGISLGDGCIVAAGSVVTRDVPERCLVAGNPAHVIRENVNWVH